MRGGILSDCEYEDFLYVQRVGVVAPYMLARLFKDHFQGMGAIVNISSTRAFQSQPDTESYTAAKGGITALTHALAVSLSGIARVNSVAPGWIDTGAYHEEAHYEAVYSTGDTAQHPSGRVGEPADIARVVDFLCDERNSFINGENITVDGGISRLMVYHNDCGWTYEPSASGKDNSFVSFSLCAEFHGRKPCLLYENLPKTDWSENPNFSAISLISRFVHSNNLRASAQSSSLM